MPPKGKQSDSKQLIRREKGEVSKRGERGVSGRGKREVGKRGERGVGEARPSTVKKDEHGRRPTTTRALILRNGKHGAMGTGELVPFANKISGREKLELLAEDLITRTTQGGVAAPLDIDKCIKHAEAQYNDRLDEIARIHDFQLFSGVLKAEVEARTAKKLQRNRVIDPTEDKENVATVVGTMVHNAHMFASGWQIIWDKLIKINKGDTAAIKAALATDEAYRAEYLMLLEFVDAVVDATYANLQVLMTTTPHYKKFFKPRIGDKSAEPTMHFDPMHLRDSYRSFLDSIIIELCLPSSPSPKRILFQILHEAVDEAPREAKRFPQAVWDAIGDLSVILELQEMLVAPLRNEEGEKWRNAASQASEDLLRWQDAQIFSERASQQTRNYAGVIFPFERTTRKDVVNDMWKQINDNYNKTAKTDVESLWGLKGAVESRRPVWHKPPPKPKTGPLAITGGEDEDDDEESNGSMPDLQSLSGSSDSEQDDDGLSDDDEDEDDDDSDYLTEDEDEEEQYDSEEEDELKRLEREAANIANLIPGVFDNPEVGLEVPEDQRNNPFVKLLGNLRGRIFSSKSKVKTTDKAAPRGGFDPSVPPPPGATPRPIRVTATTTKGTARVEEADDDDETSTAAKKKKKKKPKKKKAAGTGGDGLTAVAEEGDADDGEDEGDAANAEPEPETLHIGQEPAANIPAETPASPAAKKSSNKKKKKPASAKSPSATPGLGSGAMGESTASFMSAATATTATAQSGHAYMKETGAGAEKAKVKSRPDHATMFGGDAKAKEDKSVLMKITEMSKPRVMFGKMKKSTKGFMKKLLGTTDEEDKGGMRWDQFVKAMTDMGFTFDGSTAGSSVRFDPPNKEDGSICFHKPHPNTTLSPGKVKEYRKKLKDRYGWISDDFYS